VVAVSLKLQPDLPGVARPWHDASTLDSRVLPDQATVHYDKLYEAYCAGYRDSGSFWRSLHLARQS
jgi:hypothetical protein